MGRAVMPEDGLDAPCMAFELAPPMPDIWLVALAAFVSLAGRKFVVGKEIEFPAWYCIKASVSYLSK